MSILNPLLINILGHAAGALIFGIFLALLYSERGWPGVRGRFLPGLAAGLALGWNVGSLVVLTGPGLPPRVVNVVAAMSFALLSIVPAVLLDVSLGPDQRLLVGAGYLLSGVAVVMHCWEIAGNVAALHQRALLVITAGFLLLTLAAAVGARRAGSTRGGRMMASMCLALFTMSFLHFGTGHASQAWSSELFIHHAGIPLALFVLLQDYRFVLLDAFVRFLANALLAAVLACLVIAAAFRLVLVERISGEPLHEALLLVSICLFLVFFAWLRNRVQGWLTQAVFRQGSVAGLAQRVKNCPAFSTEEQYLDWSAAVIAAAVKTKDFAVAGLREWPDAAGLHAPVPVNVRSTGGTLPWDWAEAAIPVRLGPGNSKLIVLGRRQGGQRYLGEDLSALGQASAEIGERVESLRQQEMRRLVDQAELRALQSQINPHFLFNALNTLYGTIPREAAGARRIVLNLAEIFRYFLQTDKTFVPLANEMEIVRAYLELEQLRLGSRLRVEIEVDEAALAVPIPILSVEPLVENAIKHGVAQRVEPGFVRIRGELRRGELRIAVENSAGSAAPAGTGSGVGLQNVRRRLEICYGAPAELRLDFGGETASAELLIPVEAGQSGAGLELAEPAVRKLRE